MGHWIQKEVDDLIQKAKDGDKIAIVELAGIFVGMFLIGMLLASCCKRCCCCCRHKERQPRMMDVQSYTRAGYTIFECPQGARPGDTVALQPPGGGIMHVRIPNDIYPGMQFMAKVK